LAAILAPTKLTRALIPESKRLDDLLEQEHLLKNSKVYGIVAFLSITDTSLLQFFPWTASTFADATFGCPNMLTLRIITTAKVAQSVISSITQICTIAATQNTSSKDPAILAFLGFNIVFAVLPTMVKIFESFIRSKVLKTVATASSSDASASGINDDIRAWLAKALPEVGQDNISSIVDSLAQDGIKNLKQLYDCKVASIMTEDDLKEKCKAGKLNKIQMLAVNVAFKVLADDVTSGGQEKTGGQGRETIARMSTSYNEPFANKLPRASKVAPERSSTVDEMEMGRVHPVDAHSKSEAKEVKNPMLDTMEGQATD